MRITKSLLFSILFAFVLGTASASTDPTVKSARTEIKEMIVKAEITKDLKAETTVNVTFQVNAKNEIIVISTDSDDLDASLKAVLNYKKLKSSDISIGITYTLPIKLTK
ncbi:MAG: hypothetical protein ACJA1A_002496 [Saprospiraceae bacterium]|jgi:hypothetical protein|tara:strand:+ start:112 stop:438 length:327 start_codon:yes stop_codon:yes gene_type:complete